MRIPEKTYQGIYINLDRSPERRRNLEAQLAEFGLQANYSRFPAVDGKTVDLSSHALKPGEVGVFLSHQKALQQAQGSSKCVHIIEDDVLLSRHMRTVIEDAIAANVFDHYDLLFTDSLVNCHIGLMKNLTKAFDQVEIPPAEPLRLTDMKLMDLTQIFFAAFQSYVVGVNSIDRVLQCYQQEIANGLKTPVDIFIQQRVIAGKLRAACVFPFLTSIRIEDISNSTIRSEGGGASEIVMAVLRYLFFVGRDLDYAKRILDNATSYDRKETSHHKLMMQAVEFIMSKDFEEF